MLIKTAVFEKSSAEVTQLPTPTLPEFAFIGRSNVGKSSLINILTNHKSLAKTSSTPGKTRLINHFLINKEWYLVDLPGYGYAKVSKTARKKWHKLISDYILLRSNLLSVFVLIDVRHSPQKLDTEFMEWLGMSEIPFAIVFTKSDKIGAQKLKENIQGYKEELLKSWQELPVYFITSSTKKQGREELLQYIGDTIRIFDKG